MAWPVDADGGRRRRQGGAGRTRPRGGYGHDGGAAGGHRLARLPGVGAVPEHCTAVPDGGLGDRRPPLRDRAAGESLAALAAQGHPAAAGHHGPASEAPKLRRATPADAAAIVEIEGMAHEQLLHCGPNTREPWMLHDWLDDEDHFAYLADDGFLSYRWSADMEEIEVGELVAASAATARAFWQILGSHAAMTSRIRACLAPDDPVIWLIRDPAAELRLAIPGCSGWSTPRRPSPRAATRQRPPCRSARHRRPRPARQRRPLGAGGVRRRGPPQPPRGLAGRGGRQSGPGGAPPRRPRLRGPLRRRPLPTLRLAGLAGGGDAAADDALSSAFGGRRSRSIASKTWNGAVSRAAAPGPRSARRHAGAAFDRYCGLPNRCSQRAGR